MKPCILLGRFMPLHLGHQNLIQQIVDKRYTPVLMLGESKDRDTRYPWTFQERRHMIHKVYPNMSITYVMDADSWDIWFGNFMRVYKMIKKKLGTPVIAIHNKPEDRTDFIFNDTKYTKEYYSKIFEISKLVTIQLNPSNINIRATKIRENLKLNKKYLHPKIFKYLTNVKL